MFKTWRFLSNWCCHYWSIPKRWMEFRVWSSQHPLKNWSILIRKVWPKIFLIKIIPSKLWGFILACSRSDGSWNLPYVRYPSLHLLWLFDEWLKSWLVSIEETIVTLPCLFKKIAVEYQIWYFGAIQENLLVCGV